MTEIEHGPRHAAPARWAPPPAHDLRWGAVPPPPAGLAGLPPHPAPAPAWHAAPGVPAPRRPRWGWIVLGVVAAIAALGLVGTLVAANRPMTVQGTATVSGMQSLMAPGTSCSSTYYTGKPVSIFGADGSLIGTSTLSGYGTAVDQWGTYSYGYADACQYSFTVANVPAGEKSYRVTLGSDISNSVGFTEDELTRGANITVGH